MRRKKSVQLLIIIMTLSILILGTNAAYSAISTTITENAWFNPETFIPTGGTEKASTEPVTAPVAANPIPTDPAIRDLSNTVISEEIINIIKDSDPVNLERNLTNYKNLLINLNVQEVFKNEIERLLKAGYSLPNLLIAYSFLNDGFGKAEELEMLVAQRQAGESWTQIFKDYNLSAGEFTPRSFQTDYLENLLENANITSDDIMIADLVAAKLEKDYEEIMLQRQSGLAWKDINAYYGILNSENKLSRVQVTSEEVKKYMRATGLSEERVVDGLVIAAKLRESAETVLNKIKAGYSNERIYAECFAARYN